MADSVAPGSSGAFSADFERLRRCSTVLLTTFRRDGTPVATPVNLALDGDRSDRGFFRTGAATGKAKRLRNSDRVLLAPCTQRGKPTGESQPARAVLLDTAGGHEAEAALNRKHRIVHAVVMPLLRRFRPIESVFYEVLPPA